MGRMLKNMKIDEISLVDDPANEDARVVIVKAKGGGEFMPCDECTGAMAKMCKAKRECMGGMKKARSALIEVLADMGPQIVEKAVAGGIPADADDAATAFLEMVMDLESLTKSLEAAEARLEEMSKAGEANAQALAEAQDVIKSQNEEISELRKSRKPEDQADEFMKSLPEPVRKRLEEADRVAKAAQEQIEKMRDEQEDAAAIEKARSIGIGEPSKLGPLLRRIAKANAEDATLIESVLKAAASAATSLYRPLGAPVAVDGDPEALLKAKADEIRKGKPALSFEQAYTEALDQNPGLYAATIAKRRSS